MKIIPSLSDSRAGELHQSWHDYVRRFCLQIFRMILAWATLGTLMGACLAADASNALIGLISFAIAGQLVLGFVGLCLGCFFDRAIESVVGGIAGMLLGAIISPAGLGVGVVQPAAVTLVMGGLIGATCWPIICGVTKVVRFLVKKVR